MATRIILCIDLDAFFASVEELLHPEWRGLPVLVGGQPEERGVVASCTYAARKFGVHSAMPMGRALQLCPQAIIAPPHFDLYREHSHRVMGLIDEYGCPVEPVSVDEVFLDASGGLGGWGDAPSLAADIKRRILQEVGLRCTIGIAGNKLMAKIASNQGKPDGLLQVPAGTEAAFLAPLPIGKLWGVGPKGAQHLEKMGIRTIGDLQRAPLKRLAGEFGQWALDLQRRAHGQDSSPLVTERVTKSISRETTFVRDVRALDELKRVLLGLSEEVGHDLRREGLQAGTVDIKLRWPNFETITRQTTLKQPTDTASEIYQLAAALLAGALSRGGSVRLIGVRATNLAVGRQLSLFEIDDERRTRLERAVDDIREKFGDDSLKRGALLRRREPEERRGL